MQSLIPVDAQSDFSLHNIPFGIFSRGGSKRACTRIGNNIVDLYSLSATGIFSDFLSDNTVFAQDNLNAYIALGKSTTRKVRETIIRFFSEETSAKTLEKIYAETIFNVSEVHLHLPVKPGDYTDFYSSIEHATNVGKMFRDPANALLPNWKHLPVGYHGRSSSILVSGTPIHRPYGQMRPDPEKPPVFGPSRLLDFELEVAFVTHSGKPLGQRISTAEAEDYIFGLLLFNDWSARDIQAWEYVPLGPFLAKNFASSVSPWIVTLDALEPFRIGGPVQDPEPLPYLQYTGNKHFDIQLEVFIQPEGKDSSRVCLSNHKHLYWNIAQQLAHHTINGCNIQAGDMMASGTISGSTPDSFGSMLELSWKGTKPLTLSCGCTRSFIEDGDTVLMRAYAEKEGIRVGFGEVSTKVLPAIPFYTGT